MPVNPSQATRDRKMLIAAVFDFLHKKFGTRVYISPEDHYVIIWDSGYNKRVIIGAAVVKELSEEYVEVRVKDALKSGLLLTVRYTDSVNNIIDCITSICR